MCCLHTSPPLPPSPHLLPLLPNVSLSLSLLLVLLTALLPQTRVDRVNINSRPAMEMLFSTPGWEQRLQQLR